MTEIVGVEQAVLEKLRRLSPEKQQAVLAFVESLWQQSKTHPINESRLSLQEMAVLSLEERHRRLAPQISAMAEDFSIDPELTEFAVLDSEAWDSEYE